MAEWSLPDLDCPITSYDTYQFEPYPPCCQEGFVQVFHNPSPQAQFTMSAPPPDELARFFTAHQFPSTSRAIMPQGESPRELRNRAEKMRRDRLNQSVAELAATVPTVVAARRKVDKTTVLRLTAHYLRANQYVFGDTIANSPNQFSPAAMMAVLNLFNGFLITTTYRGIVVVVSQNVQRYLGYTQLDLLGLNLLNFTHDEDRNTLREQLMPKYQILGPNGELILPEDPVAARTIEEALGQERRRFIIRLKKLSQRSEPNDYLICHVEGSLRKSDRACSNNRCCQIVRRARARSENPCSSGNDIVFIGVIRPTSEGFINESALESHCMQYRTRHSIDGEIIQCEARIALVTGYMIHEVSGVNAMNFMHREDVPWVIFALREMYDQHRLYGESCYRLVTKNGQIIYMRTRGRLEVNSDSKAVTSFECTNTVVDAKEGRQLIKLMRRKFTMLVNKNEARAIEEIEEQIKNDDKINDNLPTPVEDPKRLEEAILHLVTNLPSSPLKEDENESVASTSSGTSDSPPHRLTLIPPNKERIVRSIEKIYTVLKTFPKASDLKENGVEGITGKPESKNHVELPTIEVKPQNELISQNVIEPVLPNVHEPVLQDMPEALPEDDMIPDQKPIDITDFLPAPDFDAVQALNFTDDDPEKIFSILEEVQTSDFGIYNELKDLCADISDVFENVFENDKTGAKEPVNLNDLPSYDMEPLADMDPKIAQSIFEEASNLIPILPQEGVMNSICGIKRPIEFEDDYGMASSRKKIITNNVRQDESRSDSPFKDAFLDEIDHVNEDTIETAINLLPPIDPCVNLLTATEVGDLLNQI